MDDGSTDGSTKLAREYAERFPEKIRLIEHPGHRNRGVTRTRNLGAENSCGEYLAFLDSDDVWLPQKLEDQVALMERHPDVGLVYAPSEYWYEWDPTGNGEEKDNIPALAPGGRLYLPPVLLLSSHPFGTYGAPCPSSFLVRRSAFCRVGGFVESFNPDTFQLYEDTAFLTKLYLRVPVFVSDLCSDRYRCHPGSIWHRMKGTNLEELERRYYFRWLAEYLRENRITDPTIRKVIRRKAWPYRLPLSASATRLLRRIGNRLSR